MHEFRAFFLAVDSCCLITPLLTKAAAGLVVVASSCSGDQVGYLAQRGLMAPSPRVGTGSPESWPTISEDFLGSSTWPKEINLATVCLSADVFLFILEEHKRNVELLITAYWEFFSTLSFSLRNMLMKIILRLQ